MGILNCKDATKERVKAECEGNESVDSVLNRMLDDLIKFQLEITALRKQCRAV